MGTFQFTTMSAIFDLKALNRFKTNFGEGRYIFLGGSHLTHNNHTQKNQWMTLRKYFRVSSERKLASSQNLFVFDIFVGLFPFKY